MLVLPLLPQLSAVPNKYMPPARKDLRPVRGSAARLTAGTLIIALSSHPALFAAGLSLFAMGWCFFFFALHNLATELVAPSRVGILNTSIAFAQIVGGLFTGRGSRAALKHEFELRCVWDGLTYMIAVCFPLERASCRAVLALQVTATQANSTCLPGTTRRKSARVQGRYNRLA